jgi:4-hydroxy-4-methyl-2-oxoglutarate aldolase
MLPSGEALSAQYGSESERTKMKKLSRRIGQTRKRSEVFDIHLNISRPDPALVKQISKLPTANLSDAAGGLNTMDSGIQAMWPGARICGPACTVATRGGDFLATLHGLSAAQRGDVLVIDNQSSPDTALWGEITTAEARKKGLAGLVANGNVRDLEGIRRQKFAVFARGTTPRVMGRGALGEVNVPVQCGGAVVRPGDIVVGDIDGVVVIPQEKAEEILRLAQDIFAYEDQLLRKVQQGLSQVDFFKLDAQFDSLTKAHLKGHGKHKDS